MLNDRRKSEQTEAKRRKAQNGKKNGKLNAISYKFVQSAVVHSCEQITTMQSIWLMIFNFDLFRVWISILLNHFTSALHFHSFNSFIHSSSLTWHKIVIWWFRRVRRINDIAIICSFQETIILHHNNFFWLSFWCFLFLCVFVLHLVAYINYTYLWKSRRNAKQSLNRNKKNKRQRSTERQKKSYRIHWLHDVCFNTRLECRNSLSEQLNNKFTFFFFR